MKVVVGVLFAVALGGTSTQATGQAAPAAGGTQPPSVLGEEAVQYLAPAAAPKFAPPPADYSPPPGFGGHAWGDLRRDFQQLPAEAASVTAAWSRNDKAASGLHCTGSGKTVVSIPMDGPIGSAIGGGAANGVAGCSMYDVANSMRPTLATADFHVLSEYSIAGQGFRMSGVVLFPVVYEFCAQWEKGKGEVPDNFEAINRYCGMRLLFPMESAAQLASLPPDHVTRFELVLNELVSRYGNPVDALIGGRPSQMGTVAPGAPRRDRDFRSWRWCPLTTKKQPACEVSIVLAADPQAARGIVIFATPALWRFAEARESGQEMPDSLFTLLHGLSIPEREAQRRRKLAAASAAQARALAEEAAKENSTKTSIAAPRTIYDVTVNED